MRYFAIFCVLFGLSFVAQANEVDLQRGDTIEGTICSQYVESSGAKALDKCAREIMLANKEHFGHPEWADSSQVNKSLARFARPGTYKLPESLTQSDENLLGDVESQEPNQIAGIGAPQGTSEENTPHKQALQNRPETVEAPKATVPQEDVSFFWTKAFYELSTLSLLGEENTFPEEVGKLQRENEDMAKSKESFLQVALTAIFLLILVLGINAFFALRVFYRRLKQSGWMYRVFGIQPNLQECIYASNRAQLREEISYQRKLFKEERAKNEALTDIFRGDADQLVKGKDGSWHTLERVSGSPQERRKGRQVYPLGLGEVRKDVENPFGEFSKAA